MHNIPIVFEDDWLVVADKPSGLLTIPTPKNESRTLTSILNNDLIEKGITYRLHPCHRLDRDTSGLVIYAKGKSIQQKMMDEFKARVVSKTYIAFVRGYPTKSEGEMKDPIEGQSALTRYKVIGKKEGFSVVEVSPVTGRTNQVRIHFKQLGNPIMGETRFAFRKDFTIKVKRLCLHAHTLEFKHPVTGKIISLEAVLPQAMEALL
ncbi:MAG: RluA family pseudouridine synthase [Candidatus Omnitrophica bacterium]|nr:RluA family pseudouridine synthase [Candidatus Omnitrophota bacterium]